MDHRPRYKIVRSLYRTLLVWDLLRKIPLLLLFSLSFPNFDEKMANFGGERK